MRIRRLETSSLWRVSKSCWRFLPWKGWCGLVSEVSLVQGILVHLKFWSAWGGGLWIGIASRTPRSALGISCVYAEKIPWGWKLHYSWDSVFFDENLSYEEEPVAILDRQVRKLRSKEIASIKVQMKNWPVKESTWENEADMQEWYPHLFTDSGTLSRPCFLLVIVRGQTMGKLVSIVTTCLFVWAGRITFVNNW